VVATWPTRFGGAAAERSFVLTDAAGGNFARASSRWAVVDMRARRAIRLPDFIRRLPVTEPVAVSTGATPDVPGGSPLIGEKHLQVRHTDLDVVGHANNTRYVEWALEAVPRDWSAEHELVAFDVAFRREARQADILANLETRWRAQVAGATAR